MSRSAEKTREKILDAAYELFYRHGFARVGVDAIARAAGVTKRTLYYHFDSKDTVAGAVLAHQREHALKRIESWALGGADDPAQLIGAIFDALAEWAGQPRWLGSGFTRIAVELADMPGHPARIAAKGHKAEIERMLAARLAALGAADAVELARHVTILLEGAVTLVLIHGDPVYIASARNAACRLAGAVNHDP
ncbi:MAG: helix-turn-helix domain containing protein [Proteobacteria bacterium]|nr:helix-turn-helix domain containing protein [Pseudomonadota bacterium]